MSDFTLFLILFPVIFGVLAWLKITSDRKYGTSAERAAQMAGYTAPQADRSERPRTHEKAVMHAITPPFPVTTAPPSAAAPPGPPVLNFPTVWRAIGPDCIHLLIVGETHSGKSTSARAVLAGRVQAGDKIAILDPHGSPTNWGGIRAIGAGRDFAAIEGAMVELLAEMTKRYKLLAEDANYQPEPLSIFVDEWPAIQTACKKTAARFITELSQEGRKAGLRLVMLTQSDLVASLGIEGKGDIRSNFTMLLLGIKASARADVSSLNWPAALRKGEGVAYPAITDPMPNYGALLHTVVANVWRPTGAAVVVSKPVAPAAPNSSPELDPLLVKFLNGESLLEPEIVTGNEPASEAENTEKSTALSVTGEAVLADTDAVHTGTADLPNDDLSVAIRLLVNGGMSRNKVMAQLTIPGTRNDQLKRIKQALGES